MDAIAIDGFADADTRRLATRCLALPLGPQGFDADGLLAAAEQLAPANQGIGLIYGSGIDTRPSLVAALSQGRTLLGNPPATLSRTHNPRRFFDLLAKLRIPHPETRFSPPAGLADWLVKPGCGEGGKGVGFAAKKCLRLEEDAYFQRHIQGEAHSALFLADGHAASIVGFNTQWICGHDPGQPFLFAGAVNRADLSAAQRSAVEGYVGKLTATLGLVGLNSLDFMLDDGICRVLELNPRPSASMALYDEDFGRGLLDEHIAACRGTLPPRREHAGPVRALRHVFAPQDITVPKDFPWPQGCADIPNPGTVVQAGQPLCSLCVEGEDRQGVEALLKTRENEIWLGLRHQTMR